MHYVEKIEVIENDGTRTVVKAYEYDVIGGYMYFYGPGLTRRVALSKLDGGKVIFHGRCTSVFTKVITFLVAKPTIQFTSGIFKDYARKTCPSDNIIVRGLWDFAAKAAAFGVTCMVSQSVSGAIENVVTPFTDGVKMGYEMTAKAFNMTKGETTNEVSEMKEVFEESETNNDI